MTAFNEMGVTLQEQVIYLKEETTTWVGISGKDNYMGDILSKAGKTKEAEVYFRDI